MNNLQIIYQDDSILVVDKPPGLISAKTNSKKENTLEDILGGVLVHRLDKDTSGLLMVAKTQTALENLQAQFKNRSVKKEYLALVHGLVKERGKVEGSIGRNPKRHDKFSIMDDGRAAVTKYEPLEKLQIPNNKLQIIFADFNRIQMRRLSTLHYSLFTLVACRPLTGRTHQIRVHLKYAGFPIVADEKYGGRKMYRLDIRWCPRLFLHAKKLGFHHPKSGKWMEMESELPEDLKEALSRLSS